MYSLNVFLLIGTSILLFNAIELTLAKNWAVILVGINYYKYTYAFEAMAYKQYKDLVKNGIDPENIIVISPDTAAFHPSNPMPGLLAYAYEKGDFSADTPVNQYEDVPIDYPGALLGMDTFQQILSGKSNANLSAIGTGRVVKTGPNDNLFLYIHTIGTDGFFVLNNRHLLYTDTFIPFVEEMAESKAFKSMFIYMHSTSAGSMFDNYLENPKIIAYSLGGRYNEFSMCHPNKYLGAYTSTCQAYEHFTYMDKAIAKNGAKETVLDLFDGSGLTSRDEDVIHNLYGDFRLALKPIKEFYGPKMKNSQQLTPVEIMKIKKEVKERTKNGKSIIKLLTEEEVPAAEQERIENSIYKAITESIKDTKIPRNIVDERVQHLPLKKFDCYRNAVETMRSKCFTQKSQFSFLKYTSKFAKLCSLNVPKEKIASAIKSAC